MNIKYLKLFLILAPFLNRVGKILAAVLFSKSYHQLLSLFLMGVFLTLWTSPLLSQTVAPAEFGEVDSEILRGRTLYENNQFNEAIALWQQAARFYDSQGNPEGQALALIYLSLGYQKLEQWTQAETAIAASLDLLNSTSRMDAGTRSRLLAQALNTRGRLEFSLGQAEVALETWRQATAAYRQLEDEVGVTGSLMNQAQALEASGFYRRACGTLMEAIGFQQSCGDTAFQDMAPILSAFEAQPNLQLKVLGLRSLGNVLRSVGRLSQSQQVLEHSLAVAQEMQSIQDENATWFSLGNTQYDLYSQAKELYERTGLGDDRNQALNRARNHASQALEYYRQAIAIDLQEPSTRLLQIQAQLQHLRILIDVQQWLRESGFQADADALQSAIQAQLTDLLNGHITELPPSRAAVYTKLNFAQHLMEFENREFLVPEIEPLAIATQYTQAALDQAKALQDQRAQSYALGTMGSIYEQLEQQDAQSQSQPTAQRLTEAALGLAQSIQAWDIAYQWQWQLGRIYKTQGETEQAIAHYQAAVETLESVRQNLLSIDSDIQFSFRDNVEPVYRELVELLLNPVNLAEEVSQANLRQAVQEIDTLQLSELENFLRCDLTQAVEIIGDDRIDPEAAIFHPIILEDQLAVVLRLPQSQQLRLHTVPLPKQDIDQTLVQLRRELEQPYVSPTGLALSQQVYGWLIQPFEAALRESQVDTLVFVLDGALRNVPMAALYDGQQYLIENYAIAITPGLQLLEPRPLTQTPLNVLTFGLSEIRQDFSPHQDFAPLTNVELELREIQTQVPAQVRLNQDFTSSALQELVESLPVSVVHLATHGQFSSDPEQTFILAWDKRVNVNELGSILQQRERRSNAIELLVLSACKTADGDSRATLGLAGVAVQSGVRSTLASLWYVDDRATAELMGRFYQILTNSESSTSMTRSKALRQAQLELLNTSGYRAPIYWAPYVLVGNWL